MIFFYLLSLVWNLHAYDMNNYVFEQAKHQFKVVSNPSVNPQLVCVCSNSLEALCIEGEPELNYCQALRQPNIKLEHECLLRNGINSFERL